MIRFKSNSGRSSVKASTQILNKILTENQIKCLKYSDKYVSNYYITKEGRLYGNIPDTGGWNEYIFIKQIDVSSVKFPYVNLYFDKNDLKEV